MNNVCKFRRLGRRVALTLLLCLVAIATAGGGTPRTNPPGYLFYPSFSSTGVYNITWGSVAQATGYELDRSEDGGENWEQVYSGTSTSYQESVEDGSYRYRVRATMLIGATAYRTNEYDCVVSLAQAPDAPESIGYPEESATGEYRVVWAKCTRTQHYALERSNVGGTIWTPIYTDTAHYYDEAVPNGLYRYRVRAINGYGSSDWCTGTTDCDVDIVPGLTPTPEPTNTPGPDDTPIPGPTPAHLSGAQAISVTSDNNFYAALYNISGGSTEDFADASFWTVLNFPATPNTWYGAYVYDYTDAAWACVMHIYGEGY